MDFVIDKDEIVIEIGGTDDLPSHLQAAVAEAAVIEATAVPQVATVPRGDVTPSSSRCCVLDCPNQTNTTPSAASKEVRFHPMPTDPARLSLWVDAIRYYVVTFRQI